MSSYRNVKWKGLRGSSGGLFPPRSYREFFVDATNGNDANPGTSRGQPWQTIAKVNGETFRPTDRILFKRGETWTDAIFRITWDGAIGKPITFGAYGSGVRPILSPTDAIPLYTVLALRSYISISSIDFAVNGAGTYAAQVSFAYSTIDDCIFRDGNAAGLLLEEDSTHVTISDCVFRDNALNGIEIYDSVTSPTHCTVQDCQAIDNGTNPAADHGMYARDGDGHTFTRNICYNNSGNGIKNNSCDNGVISLNYCYDNGEGIMVSAEVGVDATGNTIINNILYSNLDSGLTLNGAGVDNNNFYHNTIVNNCDSGGGGNAGIFLSVTGPTGNVFKNNLIHQDNAVAATSPCIRIIDTATRVANTFDNNLERYLNHGSPEDINYVDDVGYYSWDEWQALPEDPNGVTGDPVVVTEWTDLHLQVGSPCRGAGATGTGVTEDYDGVTRGSPPDIGAYEYVA